MVDREIRNRLIVAGVTTRALAVSAARAGYQVTAVDAFGDLDLRAVANVVLARPDRPGDTYGPEKAAAQASSLPADFVAYTSNFENFPAAVARLAQGRRLLGNAADTLERVRNPVELMRVLRRYAVPTPESRYRAPLPPVGSWLLKPRRSGGGHGVSRWVPGQPIPGTMYLQQRIGGAPGSITFAGNGRNAVLLGVTRQLVGEQRLGAGRFRYCGSLLGHPDIRLFPRQEQLLAEAARIAGIVTREFGLVGLNGVDFMAQRGLPYPIEVNPRYSASMELVERAHRVSLFDIHACACQGELSPELPKVRRSIYGKAVVFAREDSLVGDSRSWARRSWLADVPRPGELIPRGRPVCTVFARAGQPSLCRQRLFRRARTIYRALRSARMRAT